MSVQPKTKPLFWPMLFLTAFVVGAVLWAFWMSKAIRQTRERRDENSSNSFFVPAQTSPPAAAQSAEPAGK